ncbi:hypothetical protein [Bosea sp. BH3]|uniref:hypothetical protein n=1 Tax=Bosea sp. BH3 TaxID=2871701 RepID=UPI0021CB507F|nr:hypothetical protein [Bosea sp. BH3]MCU4180635.1 hypothetical protein [Bosea sp. BH3]
MIDRIAGAEVNRFFGKPAARPFTNHSSRNANFFACDDSKVVQRSPQPPKSEHTFFRHDS